MNDDIIIIERFSKKRYETYKAKGIPFHVVNGKGRLCEVKAFDCGEKKDQAFVEATFEWHGESRINSYYANQKTAALNTASRTENCSSFVVPGSIITTL